MKKGAKSLNRLELPLPFRKRRNAYIYCVVIIGKHEASLRCYNDMNSESSILTYEHTQIMYMYLVYKGLEAVLASYDHADVSVAECVRVSSLVSVLESKKPYGSRCDSQCGIGGTGCSLSSSLYECGTVSWLSLKSTSLSNRISRRKQTWRCRVDTKSKLNR